MTTISQKILLLLSYFLGVTELPPDDPNWSVDSAWERNADGHYKLSTSNQSLIASCNENRNSFIRFPSVIHSASKVFLNNRLLASYGDPGFKQTTGFYGTLILPCQDIPKEGGTLRWEVWSYSRYFARIQTFPSLSKTYPLDNFFYETLNIIAAGILIIFSLFNYILFKNKIAPWKLYSLIFANIFTACYFFGTVSGYFSIRGPMLITHKIADAGLWLGFLFFFNLLRLKGLISRRIYASFLILTMIATFIILTANDGDQIQLGTSLPFFPTLIMTALAMIKLSQKSSSIRGNLFPLSALGLFAFSCFNDIFVVTGVSTLLPVLPIGIMGCYAFILLSINNTINKTYIELDKYKAINEHLQIANSELKKAQAQIVHKSRLEALGTLSAGIAHEINNPLNHVYSFIKPLKNKTLSIPDDIERQKSQKALGAMKDCLELVFSIINSLKNFSSLNQNSWGELKISLAVSDVLTILKNKLNSIEIITEIPDSLTVYTDKVSLNQVLVNLIANAADASKNKNSRKILIQARDDHHQVIIDITDNGCGIEEKVQSRIYDPFFTTKKISEGMGLGLHICSGEMEKLGGQIKFRTNTGEGTTFTVAIPKSEAKRKAS